MFLRNKLTWSFIIAVLIIDIIWLHCSSMQFTIASLTKNTLAFCFLFTIYYILTTISRLRIIKAHHRRKILSFIINLCELLALWGIIALTMQTFSYLSTTLNRPLIDAHLIKLDSLLHFNMPQFIDVMRQHPTINLFLTDIYKVGIQLQISFLAFYSGITRKKLLMNGLYRYITTTLFLTIVICMLFPAAGPFVGYHYSTTANQLTYLQKFYALRNGSLHILNTTILNDGLVTFPSFHTILALILAHLCKNESKKIYLPILIISSLIILSTITTGWHYLGDVIMGFIVFYFVVAIEKSYAYFLCKRKLRHFASK